MAWTSDDLVSAVRRRAQMPDAAADGSVTDLDILEMANEEIALHLVPLVRESRGDYWATYSDTTIVSGTAAYRLPERAQASGLRDVAIVDSAGRERSLPQVSIEDMGDIEAWGGDIQGTKFVMMGADVRLIPTPQVSGYTLRMRYHRSHGLLVPEASAWANAISIVGDTFLGSASAYPSTWEALSDTGQLIDVVYSAPPFGSVATGVEALTIELLEGTYTMEFASLSASGIDAIATAGSVWVALAGETPIVDLPRECWPLLVSAVSGRVLEIIGDRDAAQMSIALYEREKENVANLLRPRVEGARIRIIDRNSPLRRGGRRWR